MTQRSARCMGFRRGAIVGAGIAFALLLGLGPPLPARAATARFVSAIGGVDTGACTNSTSPCKTITYAISQSVAGDTINVAGGTYNSGLGEIFPLAVSIPLTITGSGMGSGGTIVSASGTSKSVFSVNNSSGMVTLSGMSITGGNPTNGGGINNNGTLTLTSVTVASNTAGVFGGGIENSGTLSLNNVIVASNSAGSGGAIDNTGTATLTNVTVGSNTATGPGGLYNRGSGTLSLTNVSVVSNSSSGSSGGGIGIAGGMATLSGVFLAANSAGIAGGGMYTGGGTATLTNVTFVDNSATGLLGGGGGIDNDGATATLTNVTLVANSTTGASSFGGGIYNSGGTTHATNLTLVANSAPTGKGGGIANSATMTLQASIAANSTGGDCQNSGTLSSSGYNITDDATCNTIFTGPGDLTNQTSFGATLGTLANNNGPSVGAAGAPNILQTIALQPGSLAIDHEATGCPPPATDARGVTRPQGPACDSGAFEVVVNAPPLTFINQPLPVGTPTATPTPALTPTVTPSPSATATPGCASVTYAAGWNLAGGPDSTVLIGAAGSLYTFQARDTNYESLSVFAGLSAGTGYWAFFFNPTTVTLACVTGTSQQLSMPVNHFIMVGNPFDRPATLSGAQVFDTFNPATNSYTSATGTVTLQPGQGAWVFSSSGSTLTITST